MWQQMLASILMGGNDKSAITGFVGKGMAARKASSQAMLAEEVAKEKVEKALILQQSKQGSLAPETMQSNVAINHPAGSQQAALQEQGQKFSPTGARVGKLFGEGSRQVYSQNDYKKMMEQIDQQQKQDTATIKEAWEKFSDKTLPDSMRMDFLKVYQDKNKKWNTGLGNFTITPELMKNKDVQSYIDRYTKIIGNKDYSDDQKIPMLLGLEEEAGDRFGESADIGAIYDKTKERVTPKKATPTYRTLGGNIYHLQNGKSELVQKGSIDERAMTNAMKDASWQWADEAEQAQLIEKHKRFITGKTKTAQQKLNPDMAKKIFLEAGKDKEIARKIARERGYSF